MTRVFLLRHGETEWNANGILQGAADIPLNECGREQSERAAAALAPRLARDVRIVSSPLGRARETAETLARAVGVDVELDDRLVERSYGVWEGMAQTTIAERFPEESARWDRGLEPRIEGYEGHESLAARMGECLRERAIGSDLVLVGHGSALRMGVSVVLGLPLGGRTIAGLPNGTWTELRRHDDGEWTLVAHAVFAPPMPSEDKPYNI